jgi:hypothetical protein
MKPRDLGRAARVALFIACLASAYASAVAGLEGLAFILGLAACSALVFAGAGMYSRRVRRSRRGATALDDIQFTVYRPRAVRPDEWSTVLAFVHLADRRPDSPRSEPDPIEQVRSQAAQALGPRAAEFRVSSADARQGIPRESEITLEFYAEGIDFKPKSQIVPWMKDVHCREFYLRASAALDGTTARGRMSAYLGAILVAEVDFAIKVDSAHVPKSGEPQEPSVGRRFKKIFASYSHRDAEIVRQYEKYVQTLGDRYLRDVRDLRTGEIWDEAFCRLIDQADVFQLFLTCPQS